jgi:4-hydroxybenzoate polyprenyltransferase
MFDFSVTNLVLFGAGAMVMRGAGCTVNDIWDRNIDSKVERTKQRPIASKKITVPEAVAFLAIQSSIGLAILSQLNWFSIFLGAASLPLVISYPLFKRITFWPQAVLGLTFNWGALLGAAAVLGHLNYSVCIPLYFAGFFWTLVYDTVYALQDMKDDKLQNVKSTALLFGHQLKPILSLFATASVSLFALAGYMNGQGVIFYMVSVLGSACHYAWQIKTLNPQSSADCWRKFTSNTHLGALVTLGIGLDIYGALLF